MKMGLNMFKGIGKYLQTVFNKFGNLEHRTPRALKKMEEEGKKITFKKGKLSAPVI